MTYELHPLCTLFPRLSGPEFDALRDDIKENGLRQPIVLHEGMILDGGNRYRACVDAGIEPTFKQFVGGNLVSFVLSANLHRRHMTASQQAAIVASAQNWAQAQGIGRPKKSAPESTFLDTTEKRAAQSGASIATQRRADAVAKADPELAQRVAHGSVTLPRAVEKVAPQLASKSMPRKPKRVIEQPAPLPESDALAEARYAITELSEENDELRDRLAIAAMDATDEEKHIAQKTIADLRDQVKVLEAENDALKSQRDQYMTESAEKTKQILYWRKKAEKVAA